MNLQEELLQLSESYYNNRYKEWLENNQSVINNIKDVMYNEAKKGLFSAALTLCLSDDDLFNLKKWFSYTGLKYYIVYSGDDNDYDLYVKWDISEK